MSLIHRTAVINTFACFSFLFVVCSAVRFASLPPHSIAVPENGEAYFPCKIDDYNSDVYSFRWFSVDKVSNVISEIHSNDRFQITENTGLKITSVEVNDEKFSYVCTVYEDEKSMLNASGSLVVLRTPAKEYPRCNDLPDIQMDGNVELRCESKRTNADLELKMVWNSSIDLSTKLSEVSETDMIIITYSFIASKNDNGAVITCNLRSSVLGTETRECRFGPLNVKYQPNINIEGDSQLETGEEKVYVCSAEANPDVTTYKWMTSLNADKYKIENAGQAIRVEKMNKYGITFTLTCSATNSVGESLETMTVTVVKGSRKFISTEAPYYSSGPLNKIQNKPPTSYTTILSVTGAFLLLLASVMTLLLCMFLLYSRRHQSLDYTGQRIPQPDVYFEPKDSVATMRRSVEGKWKKSIGAQVPMDLDKDSISLYAENEGKKT